MIAVILALIPNLKRAKQRAFGQIESNAFAQSNASIMRASFFDASALSISRRIINNASLVP